MPYRRRPARRRQASGWQTAAFAAIAVFFLFQGCTAEPAAEPVPASAR